MAPTARPRRWFGARADELRVRHGTRHLCRARSRHDRHRCAERLPLGRPAVHLEADRFESLTVAECLRIACARHDPPSFLHSLEQLALPAAARLVIDATGLAELLSREARFLSHGQKQALELAMVLALEPQIILLDEPTAGLTKAERARIGRVLVDLVARYRLAVVLVEHDLDFVREISSRVVVLHQGKIVLDGTVIDVVGSQIVRNIYLGSGHA
jgi:branched-chain amino acid transport system permease protein